MYKTELNDKAYIKITLVLNLLYCRTVKNFGGKKIWRIESLQNIGGKKFGE